MNATTLPLRRLAALAAGLFVLSTAPRALADHAPVTYFPGNSTAGWTLLSSPQTTLEAITHPAPDGGLWVAGKPPGFFQHQTPSDDFTLHVEWRWPGKPGNGGILIHICSGPKDRVWPLSYQIQLKHGSVGDILPMAGAGFATSLTTKPGAKIPLRAHSAADSEKAVGEWNACDIVCRGDSFEVFVNGVLQNQITGCQLSGGQIGFQLEGTPFELRNVRLTPLDWSE